MISGDLYYVEEDEVKNLDSAQIPLKQKPSTSCKKCYGRFHIGKYSQMQEGKWQQKYYAICPKCAPKCIDWDAVNKKEVKVELPRTTTEIASDSFNDAINLVK